MSRDVATAVSCVEMPAAVDWLFSFSAFSAKTTADHATGRIPLTQQNERSGD